MLIGNDIIKSKEIIIDVKKRKVIIGNCDVTIIVEIKSFNSISRSIYLRKTIIISSRTKMLVVVHHFNILKN